MICGIVYMSIIDPKFGTEKHGVQVYDSVAIGTFNHSGRGGCGGERGLGGRSERGLGEGENEGNDEPSVDFVCEFNVLNPFYKGIITSDDGIAGHMTLKSNLDTSLSQQILTFIPPSQTEIKRALDQKDQIFGIGVLEFTANFSDNPIQIRYEIDYKRGACLVKKIRFRIPISKLKESQKVIENMEKDRLNHLVTF